MTLFTLHITHYSIDVVVVVAGAAVVVVVDHDDESERKRRDVRKNVHRFAHTDAL
jgi:hypothetical protein